MRPLISLALMALSLGTCGYAQTEPPQRVRVSSGVMWAQKISGQLPRYTEEAIAQHVSGGVVMHVIIGTDGKVKEVTPIGGPEMLRKSWCDTVRTWVYKPYLVKGKPVEVDTTVTVNYSYGG